MMALVMIVEQKLISTLLGQVQPVEAISGNARSPRVRAKVDREKVDKKPQVR